MVWMNNTHIFSLFRPLGFSFCLWTGGLNIHALFSKKKYHNFCLLLPEKFTIFNTYGCTRITM